MYAGMLTTTLRKAQFEEGVRFIQQLYDDVVIPFTRRLSGYQGAFTMVDRGRGEITGIVLYATEADARQLNQQSDLWRQLFAEIGPEREAALRNYLAAPLERRVQNIIAQDAQYFPPTPAED
jgi:hypothetical protein